MNTFFENLYNYLQSNEMIVSYDSKFNNLIQINKNEYEQEYMIKNLIIKINDVNLSFNNNINFILSINNEITTYKSIKSISKDRINYNNKDFKNVLEMLPFKEFVYDIKQHCDSMFNRISGTTTFERIAMDQVTLKLTIGLCEKYKLYNKLYTYVCIRSLFDICLNNTDGEFLFKTSMLFKQNKIINIFNIKIDSEDSSDNQIWRSMPRYLKKDIRQINEVRKWFNNIIGIENNNKMKDIAENSNLNIAISSNDKDINLHNEWVKFISILNKSDKLDNNNNTKEDINIFDINIKRIKNILKKGSPKEIVQIKNQTTNENEDIIIDAIDEEFEMISVIDCKRINNTYKDFSTLYLKKHDSHVLSTILHNFKNKKIIYKDLGLPYKFGVLLHGEPGTGKSSAILAIASYLQRDIYYLDFNNITTNAELKSVFNKVNDEMSNNGILVMEDIDVMTNIVHDRSLNKHTNTALTLECFLNLLQGTLTKDGSIFIATTNNINILDKAFIRDGRFDVKIHLEACDHYQMNLIYNKFFNRSIPEELIKKIPELKITPATFISKTLPYLLTEVDDKIIIDNIIT